MTRFCGWRGKIGILQGNTLGTAIGVWIWHLQSKRLNAQRSANPGKGET